MNLTGFDKINPSGFFVQMKQEKPLILFDIDGTLIKGGNPFHFAANRFAMQQVMGVEVKAWAEVSTSGFTDIQAYLAHLARYSFTRDQVELQLPRLFEAEKTYFRDHAPEDMSDQVLPGVIGLLDHLVKHNFLLGLISGGMEDMSWEKLRRAGLGDFFGLGGFGDQAECRDALVGIALKKAGAKTWISYGRQNAVYVGDTPTDIMSAHRNGLGIIAVASGPHSIDELKLNQPEAVLADLSDIAAFVTAVDLVLADVTTKPPPSAPPRSQDKV